MWEVGLQALAYFLSFPEMKNGGIDPNPKSDSNSMDWLLFHSDHIVISIKKGGKKS